MSDVEKLPSAEKENEKDILAWGKAVIKESLETYQGEPAVDGMEESKRFLWGKHNFPNLPGRSNVYVNWSKKLFLEMVAGMSDVRPVWEWRTENKKFEKAGDMLNKQTRAWWANTRGSDVLSDALKWAGIAGSGYLLPRFDPKAAGGQGEVTLLAMGPHDVLPFRPTYSNNVQDWQGVIIRQVRSVNELHNQYPERKQDIKDSRMSWFPEEQTGRAARVLTPVDVLMSSRRSTQPGTKSKGMTDHIRIYIKDDTLHKGAKPIRIGPPDTNWSYMVYPLGSVNPETGEPVTEEEARLFPRGRLLVMTPDARLYDGPNPYWHGEFPAIQVSLDPVPWSLLGLPFLSDYLPIQKELNDAMRGFSNGMRQWFKRGIIADKQAMANSNLRAIDTSAPGFQLLYNGMASRQPVALQDGPRFDSWMFEFTKFLVEQGEAATGSLAFRNYLALKQAPSADALQQMMDALSPMLRNRVNSVEVALGRLAEQMKFNFAQFYSSKRRSQMLGEGGIVIEDIDFDPGTFVPGTRSQVVVPGQQGEPALEPNPNYEEEGGLEYDLDKVPDRSKRAQRYLKNFTFYVTPGSLLNIGHMQTKLFHLQLYARGIMDPWTVWDAFDIKGTGPMPAETIPERIEIAKQKGIMVGMTEMMVQLQQMMLMAQAQASMGAGLPPGVVAGGAGKPGGASGQPPGRPASFQTAPVLETRTGPEGTRPVTSTSK